MFTPLAKALGLRKPKPRAESDPLQRLALMGKCAGDRYYVDMTPASFDDCMRGCETEAFYEFYSMQRAVGYDAFQEDVATKLQACSGKELHAIALRQGFNSCRWVLCRIVAHRECDLATALHVYWASQPLHGRDSGKHVDGMAALDGGQRERALLLETIESRAQDGSFARTLPLPDVRCFLDGAISDYATAPWNRIPMLLRI